MCTFISGTWGKIFGCWARTVALTLMMVPWRRLGEPGSFVEEEPAGGAAPARIGVGEEVADVGLAQGAEDGVANSVHEHVGVGMPVQPFGVWDVHATEDQLAPLHQGVNVIANAHMNHAGIIGQRRRRRQPLPTAGRGGDDLARAEWPGSTGVWRCRRCRLARGGGGQ